MRSEVAATAAITAHMGSAGVWLLSLRRRRRESVAIRRSLGRIDIRRRRPM